MFLILGVILLATAFLFQGGTYEIQLYDSYFIIGWAVIFGYLGLFCCVVEGIYFWLNREGKLSRKSYKLVHITVTVISIGLLYFSQADFLAMSGIARRYSTSSDFDTVNRTVNLGTGAIILFVVVQFCFVAGVLLLLLRGQRAS